MDQSGFPIYLFFIVLPGQFESLIELIQLGKTYFLIAGQTKQPHSDPDILSV